MKRKGKHRLGGPPPARPDKWCCGFPSEQAGHYPSCDVTRNQALITWVSKDGQMVAKVNGLGEMVR